MADSTSAAGATGGGLRAPWFSMMLGLFLTVAFIWGITSIVRHQLARGGSYPSYSTPSPTQNGLRALSDTLKSIPGLEVRQDNRNFSIVKGGPETVFIMAGFDTFTYAMNHYDQPLAIKELLKIEDLPEEGATLLYAFADLEDDPLSPDNLVLSRKYAMEKHRKEENKLPDTPFNKAARTSRLGARMLQTGSSLITARNMGYTVVPGTDAERKALRDPSRTPRREIATLVESTQLPLDKELTWTSLNHLRLSPGWTVLYNNPEGRPAIATQQWGKGRVIVSASSDWLSNNGLLRHPAPRLLAWIVEGRQRILFLEKHMGFQDTRGVMWMAREHGLIGFIAGLLLLLMLFLWKNATSLAPRLDLSRSEEHGAVLLGQDSSEGFLNLLSRNISRGEVLTNAYASWVKWRAAKSLIAANRAGAMEAELRKGLVAASAKGEKDMTEQELVRLYRSMSEILSSKEIPRAVSQKGPASRWSRW